MNKEDTKRHKDLLFYLENMPEEHIVDQLIDISKDTEHTDYWGHPLWEILYSLLEVDK